MAVDSRQGLHRDGSAGRAGSLRGWLPLAVLALAALLLATALASSGAAMGASEASRSAGTERAKAKVNPPRPWRAYPLNQVDKNLSAQARQNACDFESRQRGRRTALMILSFGRASRHEGTYGTGPKSRFRSNNRIYRTLLAAGRAYRDCRGNTRKKVDIGYGFTNFEMSEGLTTRSGAAAAGRAQRRIVGKLSRALPPGVGSALAGDIEPGFDPRGAGQAVAIARAGARGPGDYYNFGTAGRCPPFGSGCQGNWSYVDIGNASQEYGIIALPEIYYPRQAKTWARVANRWDLAGRNCRRPKRRDCYRFGGVTGHPRNCAGVQYSPDESWLRMRAATRRPVGRRIIYFNPRRVGCEEAARASTARRTTAEPSDLDLPLMPVEVPGKVIEDPEPVVSETLMGELVNAWRVGTHREYTWVYAGAGGLDPQTGEPSGDGSLVITRERYSRNRTLESTIQTVDVANAGALRIVAAPLGARATDSAPRDGVIRWAGEDGVSGTLDVGTAAVRLAP